MTFEEVIEALETFKDGYSDSFRDAESEAYDIIVELIEKQTPKKPIDNGWLYCQCGQPLLMEATSNGKRFNFCPICGQAIDWGEDNVNRKRISNNI